MSKKVLLFILFCIISSLFFIWINLNWEAPALDGKQKEKAIENILGRSMREEKNISQGEKAYQGKFFSLSYPAYAQVYDSENANVFRIDSDDPKFRLVVLVEDTQGAVLDELSGVRIRRQNRLYKEQSLTIDNNAGVLFIKTQDGVERSSFFLIQGRSYSLSITGVDASELKEIYAKIMDSVKF